MAQSGFTNQQLSSSDFVESCGAVVFDFSDPHAHRVCLLNLVEKDEWMFAKGRRNIGESRHQAALRETTEETGYQCHLLPVRMATRACPAEAPANISDKPRVYDGLTEPFMCTLRYLEQGKGVKIIWWYIATLDDGALEQRGAGEATFKPAFFSYHEAIQKLTFESDREVLRKALHILGDTMSEEVSDWVT